MKVENCGRLDDQMFVVQAIGRSMEPRIHDGELCVMRKYSGGSRQGKIVLAQHRDCYDPDTGGAYSIKQYASEKVVTDDGSLRHEKITLVPFNPKYSPITVEEDDGDGYKIVAEFVRTL